MGSCKFYDYRHELQARASVGKDLAKALTKELPNFSIDNYYKYAKKYFDYTKYPDLVELRAIIKQHLV